jgi:hypothetical protein
MKPGDENGRTHEPSLRELTSDLDGLKELLISKIDSVAKDVAALDRLNATVAAGQKTAVEAALAAQEKLTAAAFAASKEAIAKSDESQRAYNNSHNDLLRKMDDQHKETLPRPEATEKFKTLDDKIDGPNGIATRLTMIEARTAGGHAVWGYVTGAVGVLVGVVLAVVALVGQHAATVVKP